MAVVISKEFHQGGERIKIALGAGDSQVYMVPFDCVVEAVPGGGGTLPVEVTYALPSEVRANTAVWTAWAEGADGGVANLKGVTAVKVSAVTAAGIARIST
jgi:hypothetical protein